MFVRCPSSFLSVSIVKQMKIQNIYFYEICRLFLLGWLNEFTYEWNQIK